MNRDETVRSTQISRGRLDDVTSFASLPEQSTGVVKHVRRPLERQDPREQPQDVRLLLWRATGDDEAEDEPVDEGEQERVEQRPDVAEDRVAVSDLEVADDQDPQDASVDPERPHPCHGRRTVRGRGGLWRTGRSDGSHGRGHAKAGPTMHRVPPPHPTPPALLVHLCDAAPEPNDAGIGAPIRSPRLAPLPSNAATRPAVDAVRNPSAAWQRQTRGRRTARRPQSHRRNQPQMSAVLPPELSPAARQLGCATARGRRWVTWSRRRWPPWSS